jgi:hypothetical protein
MINATAYTAWTSVNGSQVRAVSPGQFTGFAYVLRNGRAVPLYHSAAQELDGGLDGQYTFAVGRANGPLITLNGREPVTV